MILDPPYKVGFGKLGLELVIIALGQASADDEQTARARLLKARHFENGVERIRLGAFDKAAGVHYNDLRLRGIGHKHRAAGKELTQNFFGIHSVF